MSINPQFIYGKDGLPTNVVLSFDEWRALQAKLPSDIPQWQIDESERRLKAYYANPESTTDADDFFRELESEGEKDAA